MATNISTVHTDWRKLSDREKIAWTLQNFRGLFSELIEGTEVDNISKRRIGQL